MNNINVAENAAAHPQLQMTEFSKARFENSELILNETITLDEWKEVGGRLKHVAVCVQFWIGDWVRFGDSKGFTGKYTDRKVYDELEIITGLDRKTIQNYKYVAEATSSRRREDLNFAHHAEVAALPPKVQQKFLQIASEQGLSARQLRAKIGANDVDVIRDINRRIDERKELKESYSKGDLQKFDSRVKDLLQEINSLPFIYRIKIKQGISRRK